MDPFLLQVVDTVLTEGGELTSVEKTSFLSLVAKGGLLMIPILGLSIAAVYIFIERYMTIRKASMIEDDFI